MTRFQEGSLLRLKRKTASPTSSKLLEAENMEGRSAAERHLKGQGNVQHPRQCPFS